MDDALTGTTADGLAVRVEGHKHYPTARVWVDGIEREVFYASRMRDGGTTRYVVEGGTLTLPHRMGDTDRTPRWTPSPDVDPLSREQKPQGMDSP